ncbi:MAG: transcriptional repressor [Candidatus Omnitrophota bacterium]|nr:MAG: transcriptional repressor [Candidatus Omnitrophota bacterium]
MPGIRLSTSPWWQARFRGCGYRWTLGREAILEVLSKSEEHLSAEDIYLRVHPKYPNIGLTTIYRTLDILTDMGLVWKFDFGDGRARYELIEGSKKMHHHHLICKGCNRIVDYTEFIEEEKELVKKMQNSLSKKYNFKITSHIIQFYGFCSKCDKQKD